MLEERTKELIKSERQAAFSQFMQGIIHNLRSPISVVLGTAGLIKQNKADADILSHEGVCNVDVYKRIFSEIWEGADTIIEAANDLNSMIQSMMIKSRQDKTETVVEKDLNEILRKELEFLEADLELKHKVKKEVRLFNEELLVEVVPGEINQVIQNLIQNAKDSVIMKDQDRRIAVSTGKKDQFVFFEISDSGHGIPEDKLARIFEPFYTTKAELKTRAIQVLPVPASASLSVKKSSKATMVKLKPVAS